MGVEREECETNRPILLAEIERLRASEDRLNAEIEALREAVAEHEEARGYYLDAYDLAPVAYLSLDRNGVIRRLNRQAWSLLLPIFRNLIGAPLFTLLAPGQRRRFLEHAGAARQGLAAVTFEAALKSREGAGVAVRLSLRWTEEQGGGYAAALVDLSERDAALADSARSARAERASAESNKVKDCLIAALNRSGGTSLAASRAGLARDQTRSIRLPLRSHRRHRIFR